MRILFMGSPAFAVPSLRRLAGRGWVVGVVTQPDRPVGRGMEMQAPAVKEAAVTLGLPVLQPPRLREPEVLPRLAELRPDLIVVVAYGQILRQPVLELPPLGCINLHGSLLPAYRGAAPIQWAIIRGERKTGVTTILMDPGMDTGPILLMEETPIGPEETAGELAGRLAEIGAALLERTVVEWSEHKITPRPQPAEGVSYAPLLKKEDGIIDWGRTAVEVAHLVRGTDPWPGAHTIWRDRAWRVWRGRPRPSGGAVAGRIIAVGGQGIDVATGSGRYRIEELQEAGSRRMRAAEYLAGHAVAAGDVLGSASK